MYVLYKQASNLGVQISSESIDVETLQILHDFEVKVAEVNHKIQTQKNKRKR